MSAKIVFVVLLLFLVLGGVVAGFIYVNKKQATSQEEELLPYEIFLVTLDNSNNNSRISADYIIESSDGSVFSGKTSRDSFTSVKLPVNNTFRLNSFAEGFYTNGSSSEGFLVVPKSFAGKNEFIELRQKKNGGLRFAFNDTLKNGTNNVLVNITPIGYFRRTGFCFSWSSNVIYANIKQGIDGCGNEWLNYTLLPNGTMEWLPKKIYACVENDDARIHVCNRVEGEDCHIVDMSIPLRLSMTDRGFTTSRIDHCYDFDYSFHDREDRVPDFVNYEFELQVKAENPDEFDYVEVLVMDKDRFYVPELKDWVDGFEKVKNEKYVDVGGPDQIGLLKKV